MSLRRALVCSFYPPEPDRDSGSQSLADFMDYLREGGWELSFLAINSVRDARYARALQQKGIALYDGADIDAEKLLRAGHFDVVLLNSWMIGEYFTPIIRRVSPRARVVVNSLDLHFLREARRTFQGRVGEALDEAYAERMIGELNVYAGADAVLTVSQKEADLINDLVADPSLAHVAPDAEKMRSAGTVFDERRGMLFVGGFAHPPNAQAVEYLCKDVLPRINTDLLAEHPVYIVGNGLDDVIRGYGRHLPNVRMVGWVPSVDPYYERVKISVIPLLYGAGTKRKTVQSLAAGIPAVTTSIGAEGLNLVDGEHALIANDAASFARSIERLLTDRELWQQIGSGGRAHIEKSHSPEVARASLLKAFERVLQKEPKQAIIPEGGQKLYERRLSSQYFQRVAGSIRDKVREVVDPQATVIVISDGASELLKLDARKAWHFPQDADGKWSGSYPSNSQGAISQFEALRAGGGEFLLIPAKERWWLTHYPEFRSHIESCYKKLPGEDDVCIIYALGKSTARSRVASVRGEGDENSETPSQAGEDNGQDNDVWELPVPEIEVAVDLVSESPAATAGQTARPWSSSDEPGDVKLIAFYLPQFHPISENDEWWGDGFTEWTNVAKAEPLFPGHYQPRLPSELGFCDLRLSETRRAQADLAKQHGIHGFCYYHYWFNGKRLLERPFNEVLETGDPDFPFCLAWANEQWSRRWDGRSGEVLQAQSYSLEDDIAHIRWLMKPLSDPRAIKIDGRPVFMVYKGLDLPDPRRTTDVWRREVERAGLKGIYLIAVETGWDSGWDATQAGFDAKVLFQPQFSMLYSYRHPIQVEGKKDLKVFDYQKVWPMLANPDPVSYRRYETVFPSWDNTARQGDSGTVLHNSTPDAYEQWLRYAISRARVRPPEHRVVFINAWNEWAEGAHLEPDLLHGRAYLEATRRAWLAAGKSAAAGAFSQLHATHMPAVAF